MPRWYKGFRCNRIHPDSLIEQIREQLHRHKLTNVVPVVRVEKRKHGKRQRGEYYLFLAVESPNPGQIPQPVQSALQCISALNSPVEGSIRFEHIKSMVRAEYNLEYYDNVWLIPHKPPPLQDNSDPFEREEEISSFLDEDDVLLNTRRYNQLLLWLSAVGEGSWRTFQNACREFGLVHKKSTPTVILRHLRLCGHIETSFDRSKWTVAPSVLVRCELPVHDEGEYFLCGARDVHMVEHVQKIAHVSEHTQEYGHAPAKVSVQTSHLEQMKNHVSTQMSHLHIADNVAYRLAQRLPPLAGWMDTLQTLPGLSPYQFLVIKRFTGKMFEAEPFDDSKSGMYELWRDEPPAQAHSFTSARPDYTLFYDAQKQRWLRGDWYGMRFLALQLLYPFCPILYYSSSGQLAIPQDWHWPELYERVLVLASGKLPHYNNEWLIYESISQRILDALALKLNLKIQGDDNYA